MKVLLLIFLSVLGYLLFGCLCSVLFNIFVFKKEYEELYSPQEYYDCVFDEDVSVVIMLLWPFVSIASLVVLIPYNVIIFLMKRVFSNMNDKSKDITEDFSKYMNPPQ